MLFNTLDYVIFLPLVVILYFLIPSKYRWMLLLVASYYFYMSWRVEFILLIIISTVVDYFCALKMEKSPDKKARRPYLILSLFVNLGLLFSFKYLHFFLDNLNLIFQNFKIPQTILITKFLLPVGISFYTFQTLSYSIDVYFGKQKAEKHLGYFALFVSFFPQLVAGPIERFSRLAPQLKAKQTFSYKNMVNGLRLTLYGLFIKMVIADNISGFVDKIYANPENYSSLDILKGIFLYSYQIYCDFHGYSTIALGSAMIMGIKIMDNFRTPYLSKSISEFWTRWHISLSTWFKDYLYIPLGGNRVSKLRWISNIIIVFIVSGLWHGANWTFLFWGGLFGMLYLSENLILKIFNIKNMCKTYSWKHLIYAIFIFILVSFLWIFFRSQSLEEALNIIKLIFTNDYLSSIPLNIPNSLIILIAIFIISDIALYNTRFDIRINKLFYLWRWLIYGFLIFSIIVLSGVENYPFIYFQF